MIRIVDTYDGILELLSVFLPYLDSLSSRRVKPEEMARKFIVYGTVLELCENGSGIGFCSFYHNDKRNKRGYLSMIAVLPEAEGKGYAAKLIKEVERICRSDDMQRICLEVRNDNCRAIRFYQKHGYTIKEELNGQIILMAKAL